MKFPKKIYVKQEQDGKDHYLMATKDPDQTVAYDEGEITVGIYVLERTVTMKTQVVMTETDLVKDNG